jgi:hypothetical protein
MSQTLEAVAKHPPAVIEDLGDIRPLSNKGFLQRMRFTTALRGEYVSNADSVGNHGGGDFLLLPGMNAAVDQVLGHGVSLSFNARAEAFIYSKLGVFTHSEK